MYTPASDYQPQTEYKSIKTKSHTKKKEYLERWISLDTETSHNHNEQAPIGWIYQWAFKFGDDIVYGRKPSELIPVLVRIASFYKLDEVKRAVIYVHNLSYDFQYLKDYIIEEWHEYSILAIAKHHIINFVTSCFEWRCSYKLSNKSLAKWSKDLGCKNRKLEGFVDYEKIHYQSEELTAEDWAYMYGDVETLDECIERQLLLYNDNISTVPLTSTGYIRRDCRRNFQKDKHNFRRFQRTALNSITYKMCRAEFSGGLTHGDRFRVGETVRAPEGEWIGHRDFRSHYPSQQRTKGFPMANFCLYAIDTDITTVNEQLKDHCILCEIEITNAEIKGSWVTFPYLQVSKCIEGRGTNIIKMVKDNGRVLQLAGTTTLYCNEHDLKWLLRLYRFEHFKIKKLYVSKRGYLPEFMIDTIDSYFEGKTKYKKLAKAETDKDKKLDFELSLMKSKNGLNGIYGCSATDPVRATFELNNGAEEVWSCTQPESIDEALESFYNSRNNFMRYQWGCWTTSSARDELMTFIYDVIGVERCIYCDTDSIFYLASPETEAKIEDYNKKLEARSIEIGAFIEYEGERVTYNSFEAEENIQSFRFLHAKCYAFEDMEGELHCTIAGVPARIITGTDSEGKATYYTREEELGSIDELDAGKVFTKCGGTAVSYQEHYPDIYYNEVEATEYSSSAILLKTTKTLSSEIEAYFEPLTYSL